MLPHKLAIFDFDDTLFRIPHHSISPDGFDNPHKWYESAESLDNDKYRIYPILKTQSRVEEVHREGYRRVLVTRRHPKMEPHVKRLCALHNIWFNETYVVGWNSKAPAVIKEIEYLKAVTSFNDGHGFDGPSFHDMIVEIWEDSIQQVHDMVNAAISCGVKPENINVYYIDKTQWFKLETANLGIVPMGEL